MQLAGQDVRSIARLVGHLAQVPGKWPTAISNTAVGRSVDDTI